MQPLTGFRDHRIDAKQRVVIPAAYANRIRSASGGRLYLVPSTGAPCLEAHPAQVFEELAGDQVPNPFESDQKKRRHFFQNAELTELKGPGRITLPKRFLSYFPAGVVRVAGFNTYLELWDPEAWERDMASAGAPPSPGPGVSGT